MPIINFKPTTASRRNMSVTDYSALSKVAPEKSLLAPTSNKSGRNSYGRITVRHRGGANRKKYRIIDFKRQKTDAPGTVLTLEYDPNRSAFIALVQYEDGEKRYIIAPHGLKVGDIVVAGPTADIKPGNALPLENIPVGTFIHNVELYPGKGAQLARAAGNMAQLMAKENGMALLRLPSGELRNVPVNCMAQSARSVTSTMRMLKSVRPVANATWVGDQQSAVLS
jgi:large subunit ribosomal protein L2